MSRVLVLRHHLEDHPGLIGEAFRSRGFNLDVIMMDHAQEAPELDGYDVLVVLGSKCSVYDPEVVANWFGREIEILEKARSLDLAVLGICFGAQALCVLHGGRVVLADSPEIGWFEIEQLNDSGVATGPWFEYHFDRCELPSSAQVWARSPSAVQAFAIGRHVGVQFHPEVDHLQLKDWFDADDQDPREFGVDAVALLQETERLTPSARLRAHELVDHFLRYVGL
ncbi:MAG: hypothetical protein HKL86_05860 [Acidimicrobiaceae bacterium]|nr:hypothetical protein [Acidimicrobiaceae bacterium]